MVHKTPPATAAKADPTQAVTPPVAPTTTPPGAATSQPPTTVTVPPQTAEPTTAGSSATGGTTATATGRHRKHKNAVANSDSQPNSPAQTGPVTTGVEPSTCDADGDGVADPGSPSGCGTSDGTVGTAVQQGTVAPTLYSAPKRHKAAPKKSASKKRVSQRRK